MPRERRCSTTKSLRKHSKPLSESRMICEAGDVLIRGHKRCLLGFSGRFEALFGWPGASRPHRYYDKRRIIYFGVSGFHGGDQKGSLISHILTPSVMTKLRFLWMPVSLDVRCASHHQLSVNIWPQSLVSLTKMSIHVLSLSLFVSEINQTSLALSSSR